MHTVYRTAYSEKNWQITFPGLFQKSVLLGNFEIHIYT